MADLPPPTPPGPPPYPTSPPSPPPYPMSPPLAPPPPPVPPGADRWGGLWAEPPTPPPPPPTPSRDVPAWAVAVIVVAVLALLGGGLVVVVDRGSDDDREQQAASDDRDRDRDDVADEGDEGDEGTPTTDEPTATTEAPADPDFDGLIAEIEAFVAEERGLPFLREVVVEVADDEEFEARLLADFEEDIDDIVATGRVLEAIGLVPAGTDLVAAFRSLLGAGVAGFYDGETDELVVRGTDTTPYVRSVIAHELTHALDDQHFELDRPELEDAEDESGFGFVALVEGNASRVQDAYEATFSPADAAVFAEEEIEAGSSYDFSEIPFSLYESLIVPYILGPALIDEILAAGGQALLDATFVAPPLTSEALIEPATFLAGQAVLAVPTPTPDGTEIDRGMLGSVGLAQILGELTPVVTGIGSVSDAVLGWGGDQYVAWTEGDRACLRSNLVGDTPRDTEEIAEALSDFALDPPFAVEATVSVADGVVTFTSCG